MKFTCANCGLYSKRGLKCYLRFEKSPKPRYSFIRQKTPDGGLQDRCIAITPAPRIQDPDGLCEAWRNASGKTKPEVLEALAAGRAQT